MAPSQHIRDLSRRHRPFLHRPFPFSTSINSNPPQPNMAPYEEDGLPPHLLSSLISTTPWNEQVQSLAHLTDLALSPSAQTLRQLRSLAPYFQSAIDNPRSTLVRSVCETISTLAETLKAPFVEAVGNSIIPNLLNRSAVTKAVIRESCVNAARSMFEHGVEGVHFATARTLAEAVSDRRAAPATRATAALFLGMIMVDNCRSGVHYIIDVVATAIIAGCADPDETVRATSRQNWRRLHGLDPAIAAEVLNNLPAHTVQLINREREEFGDPFRPDRAMPARVQATADPPVRSVSRSGFRPGRVEVEEQSAQRKKPHFRPPRRSVFPGAFAIPHPTPEHSPPKKNEMHPVRRIFSPMVVDTPAPVHTPAPMTTPATVDTVASTDTRTPVDTVASTDTRTPVGTVASTDTHTPEGTVASTDTRTPEGAASANRLSSPEPEDSPTEPKSVASESPDTVTTQVYTEKSAVSAVSCSSGSHSGTPDSLPPLTDRASHTTESSVSSLAGTEKSVSAVSSSSVTTASTAPSDNNEQFQKIAVSGASRATNEDCSIETPPRSEQSGAYSVSADASSPEVKKGRLSYILGSNQTPRVYNTPAPPISRMMEQEDCIKPFTPMDICTPMKTEEPHGSLSGVVIRPLARALEGRLDEVAQSDDKEHDCEPATCDVAEENIEPAEDEDTAPAETDVSRDQDFKEEETSPEKDEFCDTENSADFEKAETNANQDVLEKQEPAEGPEEASEKDAPISPDLPSTPDSFLEDDLLRQVACLTSSAEKKQTSPDSGLEEDTSWDTLVEDLAKTLGLDSSVTDDTPVPEKDDSAETPEPPSEKIEASGELEIVKPGEGKENRLPLDSQKPSEVPKSVSDASTSAAKVEEKKKTEMTKAERQAALARRPPRRSINPGAIKPMSLPVEKKSVRPSLPPPKPPRTEKRKPPVPSFSRKPPVPRKAPTASNNSSARPQTTAQKPATAAQRPPTTAQKPPTTAQKPPSTARKPPTTARKLPLNRPRASTVFTRPSASASSVRRASIPPTRQGQPSTANATNKPKTTHPAPAPKPVSALPPKAPKAKAPVRKQTPRQIAVIDAYRACARVKKGDWSAKWKSLQELETAIKGLQGDTLPPRLCDDATGLLGEFAQETHHKVQRSALDALFFLLLCTERPAQISALHRALEKRPEILRRVLGLLKDGREDVRLACGRVMQSFEVLFGPEVQVGLLVKAVSGVEGKIAEMGCIHMLKTFERAKHGDGFVWKAGALEALVSLLASLKQNRRVEVRQAASKVLEAVKECLPDRAFDIVCKKVGVTV